MGHQGEISRRLDVEDACDCIPDDGWTACDSTNGTIIVNLPGRLIPRAGGGIPTDAGEGVSSRGPWPDHQPAVYSPMDIPADHDTLFRLLDDIDVSWTNHEHPAVFTVDESKRLRGELPGAHIKNLFLRDKKRRYFLVTALEHRPIDLKSLRHRIDARGGLSFGSVDRLWEVLGLRPGAVTPFGVINDRDHQVTVVLDNALADEDPINAHPLRNDMTIAVTWRGLLSFLEKTGHAPVLLDLDAPSA